jgi:hypothetical protein
MYLWRFLSANRWIGMTNLYLTNVPLEIGSVIVNEAKQNEKSPDYTMVHALVTNFKTY